MAKKKKKKLSKSQKAKQKQQQKKLAKERAQQQQQQTPKQKSLTKPELQATEFAKQKIEDFSTFKTGKSDISKMESILRTFQTAFKTRAKEIAKSGLYSSAIEGAIEHMEVYENSIPSLRKEYRDKPVQYRNRLLMEIAKYHTFFNNKTSSVEGINAVNTAQDQRIFGDEDTHMTEDERRSYWSAYNEFMRQNKHLSLDSGQVQRTFGELFKKERSAFQATEEENNAKRVIFAGQPLLNKALIMLQGEKANEQEENERRFGAFGIQAGMYSEESEGFSYRSPFRGF